MRKVAIILSLLTAALFIAPAAHAASANDAFGSATTIGLPATGSVSTVGNTTETGEQTDLKSCVAFGGNIHTFIGATAWYKYTPVANTNVFFDTFGSNFSTVVVAYRFKNTQPPPANLITDVKKLSCNISSGPGGGNRSRVGLAVSLGQTYYFQVAGLKADAAATPATGTLIFHLGQRIAHPGIAKGNVFSLNAGFDSSADHAYPYGSASDAKLVGTAFGDGVAKPIIRRGNVFYMNNGFDPAADLQLAFGSATDKPIFGDWNGDGYATPGVVRGNAWYLYNDDNTVTSFAFGSASDRPVVGDWDGDRDQGIGVVRGNEWFLSDTVEPVLVTRHFTMGNPSDTPIVGDWDGDGNETPGDVRGNVWTLNDKTDSTPNRAPFTFGTTPFLPIAGDWAYAV